VGNASAVLPGNGALHKAAGGTGLACIAFCLPAVWSGLVLEKMTQQLEGLSRHKSRKILKQCSKFQKIFRQTSRLVVMRQSSDSVS
jgi:hypothetical protein